MNVNKFDMQYSKIVSRKDVYTLETDVYASVLVQTDNNEIAVIRHGESTEHAHTLVTESSDSVIFKLTVLSYGRNTPQGADILSRINRIIETRDTVWCAASRINGEVIVDSVMTRKSANGVITWSSASLADYGLSDVSASKLIFKFVARLESGKKPIDQRNSDNGLYADYVAQQAAARS